MERISATVQEVVYKVAEGEPSTKLPTPANFPHPARLRDWGQAQTALSVYAEPAACPTCGTPPGVPGYMRADVATGHEDFGKLAPCPMCHAAKVSDNLKAGSQLDGVLEGYTFENYKLADENRAAYDAALEFAGDPTGWLTLWGSYGPGKTHLLAAIANQLTKAGKGAIYYTLPDLLDELRSSYKDDFSGTFHRVANVPVLLIDEVDKVNPTLWAMEKAYQLFDARYRGLAQFGTVFAMNIRPEINDDHLDYLVSRMLDRRFAVVEVGGGDMRPVVP